MALKRTILFPFVGDTVGGSHIATLELLNSLPKSYYSMKIMLFTKGKLSEYLDSKGIKYEVILKSTYVRNGDFFSRVIDFFNSTIKIVKFLNEIKVDIVHTNDLRMHYTFVLACFLTRTHHVWHQRSEAHYGILLSLLSSKLITITNFCKGSFPSIVSSRAKVICDPVKVNYLPSVNKSNNEVNNIILISNVLPIKRIDVAFRVLKKFLNEHNSNAILSIYGEKREPEYSKLCHLSKELGICNNVKFMGVENNIEKRIIDSDVLLATSQNEGMGRTLVEAMLLNIPVIASNSGGHKEVIIDGFNGYLVEKENANKYLEALKKIEDTKIVSILVGNARKYAVDKYSVELHAREIEMVYSKLLCD